MSTRYEEEAAKLTATLLNGIAVAAFVGATIGQLLAPDAVNADGQFLLFVVLGIAFHMTGQTVLWLAYRD